MIDKLNKDPHLILVDEANHLSVAILEVMRHVHDMTECGMVLVGATQRLYDLFTNGGRKSQDLEQLWSRVGIQDLAARQLVKSREMWLRRLGIVLLTHLRKSHPDEQSVIAF